MQVKGCYAMTVTILDRKVTHFFYVVKNLSSPVIFGIDFINQHCIAYDPVQQQATFVKGWETAAATVSQRTVIEANSSVKIPIAASTFPFNGDMEIQLRVLLSRLVLWIVLLVPFWERTK